MIKPIVAKTFPLTETVNALRYLVEGRPIGRVILTILARSEKDRRRAVVRAVPNQVSISYQ